MFCCGDIFQQPVTLPTTPALQAVPRPHYMWRTTPAVGQPPQRESLQATFHDKPMQAWGALQNSSQPGRGARFAPRGRRTHSITGINILKHTFTYAGPLGCMLSAPQRQLVPQGRESAHSRLQQPPSKPAPLLPPVPKVCSANKPQFRGLIAPLSTAVHDPGLLLLPRDRARL
jgi:hypothetical protein